VDMKYAKDIFAFVKGHKGTSQVRPYISVGNDVGQLTERQLLDRYDELLQVTLRDPELKNVPVLPQMHVLLWNNARGR
jgi:7-carboxy-7-deazaguanine synthase